MPELLTYFTPDTRRTKLRSTFNMLQRLVPRAPGTRILRTHVNVTDAWLTGCRPSIRETIDQRARMFGTANMRVSLIVYTPVSEQDTQDFDSLYGFAFSRTFCLTAGTPTELTAQLVPYVEDLFEQYAEGAGALESFTGAQLHSFENTFYDNIQEEQDRQARLSGSANADDTLRRAARFAAHYGADEDTLRRLLTSSTDAENVRRGRPETVFRTVDVDMERRPNVQNVQQTDTERRHPDAVDMEELFGNSRRNRAAPDVRVIPNAVADANQAWRDFRDAQRQFGGLVTPAQQRAAERRLEQQQAQEAERRQQFLIDWNDTEKWPCPGPGGDRAEYPIATMADKHIWETVIWIVREHQSLFTMYGAEELPHLPPLVASKQWLKTRPLFRAMLQETVKRQMRYPQDVFDFLVKYVFGGRTLTPVKELPPWENPEADHQLGVARRFADEPLHVEKPVDPIREYGKDFRQIEI